MGNNLKTSIQQTWYTSALAKLLGIPPPSVAIFAEPPPLAISFPLSPSRCCDLQPSRRRRAAAPWIPLVEALVMAGLPLTSHGGPAMPVDLSASEPYHSVPRDRPSTATTSLTSPGLHLASALPTVRHRQAPCLWPWLPLPTAVAPPHSSDHLARFARPSS